MLRRIGLAAVPAAVFFVVVLRHMTYAWDDFIQFGVTVQSGLSRTLLTYNLFEHFAPLNRAVHGLLLVYGGLDPRWAIAVALPIFFAYSFALTDLARLLGASWARTALCLAVTTVTPATAFIGAFLDPYFHVMGPVAATAAATAAYVRWVRTRRFLHVAVGAAVVGLACTVQERGAFIVLFLMLARVLIIEGGVPLRRWIPTWLRDWPFLLLPGLTAVAAAGIVALFYAADAPRGSLLQTASLVAQAWTLRLVPMLTGLYQYGPFRVQVAVAVAVNLVVVALFAWTVRRARWNVRPWLLLLIWFGFTTTFLGFGRLGLAPLETFRDDPNYYTYAFPAVVCLIASLRLGAQQGATSALPAGRRRSHTVLFAVAALLAVLVTVSALPQTKRPQGLRPEYLAASVNAVRQANQHGPAVIAPTLMPAGLEPGQFFPYNGGEFLLKEIDRKTLVDVDPQAPRFLNAAGSLTDASAQLLARADASSPVAGWSVADGTRRVENGSGYCVSADGGGRVNVPLSTPVDIPGGAAWIRVLGTGGSSYGTVATSDGATTYSQSAPAPLSGEHGSVSFMVPATRVAEVDLVGLRADRLCISAVEVWGLAAQGAQGCGWVGSGGEIVPARPDGSVPRCPGD